LPAWSRSIDASSTYALPVATFSVVQPQPHAFVPPVPAWQVVGEEHVAHDAPPEPHAEAELPGMHCPSEQHPVHEVESQTQAPLAQCSPLAQLPV
jgi:hypothetical protein